MGHTIRLLCKDDLKVQNSGVCWLVGSFSMPFTVVSILYCLHFQRNSGDPDYAAEADDIRILLPKGLEVVGSIVVGETDGRDAAWKAANYAITLSRCLLSDVDKSLGVIAATFVGGTSGVNYLLYKKHQGDPKLEVPDEIIYETEPMNYLWKRMCLMRCEMQLKIPLYGTSFEKASDSEDPMSRAVESILADLRSSRLYCLVEDLSKSSKQSSTILLKPGILEKRDAIPMAEGFEGDFQPETLQCSDFCSSDFFNVSTLGAQVPNPLKLTFMVCRSVRKGKATAPYAEYISASGTTMLKLLRLNVDVVCMGASHLDLPEALSSLAIPALVDQLLTMSTMVKQAIAEQPQICSFHFCPPGFLHPVSSVYDLSYGELELNLVEVRKILHRRLGLPLDRPCLRVANALAFASTGNHSTDHPRDKLRLRNVHIGLPSSGVIGGRTSLIEGSYEYYHYLQDGFNDNGWGCAYRSLQTIVSWFKLQQYTAVEVPSHRKIQESLVEIGDKEPVFLGSREWIGAIELSFVLDKLLGVTCKILNVRSGSELPDKCRELAFHFDTQGTPVMIGGGVLAYTLLGVDYNEATGESAFLILDPHYTGADDLKNIWSGDWCGWKKAVSVKGEEFFMHNTFYNLLLPQRPNTV